MIRQRKTKNKEKSYSRHSKSKKFFDTDFGEQKALLRYFDQKQESGANDDNDKAEVKGGFPCDFEFNRGFLIKTKKYC